MLTMNCRRWRKPESRHQMLACLKGWEKMREDEWRWVYMKEMKTTKKQKGKDCLNRTKHTCIYERGTEKKNGIADNILSRKQHVKRNDTEDYVNTRRERMTLKVMWCRGERETIARIVVIANTYYVECRQSSIISIFHNWYHNCEIKAKYPRNKSVFQLSPVDQT